MARKHEEKAFSYNYGWRTAPEQWSFFYKGNRIWLDNETNSRLANMCISGKVKEAEDELKRLLRKQEKASYVAGKCICFFKKDSMEYYYTRDLMYNPNDKKHALYCYKEWKHYIENRGNTLETMQVTSGFVNPMGFSEGKDETPQHLIDLSRCKTVMVIKNPKNLLFPMLMGKKYKEVYA